MDIKYPEMSFLIPHPDAVSVQTLPLTALVAPLAFSAALLGTSLIDVVYFVSSPEPDVIS